MVSLTPGKCIGSHRHLPSLTQASRRPSTVRKATVIRSVSSSSTTSSLTKPGVTNALYCTKGPCVRSIQCGAAQVAEYNGFREESTPRQEPTENLSVILKFLKRLAIPYWKDPAVGIAALSALAFVLVLTVSKTGVSVCFNYLERDFTNALAAKDAPLFRIQLFKYLAAFFVGIPVFVIAAFYKGKLVLGWRKWMTKHFLDQYLSKRTYYKIQTSLPLDNPDQRIAMDIKIFTETAMGLLLTTLNAGVDLFSFSKILFSIYPPLFVALLFYAIGGTGASLYLGKRLVGLNFAQEAREADFRFGLIRLRENSESVAFYGGEKKEGNLIQKRLGLIVENFGKLLRATRIVDFFTMFYEYLICLLPAAVIAPLYFRGDIQLGVVTQSEFAFSHVLRDVSLVVFQIESLAGFSAVVERLGQFQEAMDACGEDDVALRNGSPQIKLETVPPGPLPSDPLLELDHLTLTTPDSETTLIKDLSLQVMPKVSLLIMGPSGSGKTSLLRAIAGLWTSGLGKITRFGTPIGVDAPDGDILFIPQKPYLVLGTLRDQLLYPAWSEGVGDDDDDDDNATKDKSNGTRPAPSDAELISMMHSVNLGNVMKRCQEASKKPLDVMADWSIQLSLGEQQRLAFARVLLSNPRLVLMDEATSALDVTNEEMLYQRLEASGITYISVGHRPTLRSFHKRILEISSALDAATGPQWEVRDTSSQDALL